MKNIILLFLFFISLEAKIVIIQNGECQNLILSKSDIKNLFLARTNYIGSHKIIVLNQRNNNLYNNFANEWLKKSPMQLKHYWIRMVFTGRKKVPSLYYADENNSYRNNCYITYTHSNKIANFPQNWIKVEINQ